MSNPAFKAKLSKNAEKQISEETLKIASAAIAASGIVYMDGFKHILTKEQQDEIIERYKNGESNFEQDYGCSIFSIRRLIRMQPNAEELKALHKSNETFSKEQQNKILEMYAQGFCYADIAKELKCNKSSVRTFIGRQKNLAELQAKNKENRRFFTPEQEAQIIEKYKNGASLESIAKEFKCSTAVIPRVVSRRPDANEIKSIHKQNKAFFTPKQQKLIVKKYKAGMTCAAISKELNCSKNAVLAVINKQPNLEELKEESKKNRDILTPEQKIMVIERYISGISLEKIANEMKCSRSSINNFLKSLPNIDELTAKNKASREFFNAEQKAEIILRYQNGERIDSIAKHLGCSIKSIYTFIRSQDMVEVINKQHRKKKTILSSEQKRNIINRFIKGDSYESIARDFECSISLIYNVINKQENFEELKALHDNNSKMFSENQKKEIISKYASGASYVMLSKEYNCSVSTIRDIIKSQPNADELKTLSESKRSIYTPELIAEMTKMYSDGNSYAEIARKFKCAESRVLYYIKKQNNIEEITMLHRKNSIYISQEELQAIIKRFRAGDSVDDIIRNYDYSRNFINTIIQKQPDIEDIKLEHKRNRERFSDDDIKGILTLSSQGESCFKISQIYNCSETSIWGIIQKEKNKNQEGTTKETFWHKYEEYSINELKTRIIELVSLKQVEENDELLEIMFYLDEKTKINEDEKSTCIEFIRLLDKLEQRKVSTKNVVTSEIIKSLFDFMDKDLIKQQIFEELNKDYSAAIDELNSCDNETLGDICSKYIAHNIDDEDNIASMKAILNIISSNNEKTMRHKLVAYDSMKQNLNDERIKEAEEIYGADNQEKIGQYLIFDQMLKGDLSYVDLNNDAWQFGDELKKILRSRQAILKRLIELEDYFNSDEAENNSLTNFVNAFDPKDNYINKLMINHYIDNIYKNKITTYELEPDSRFFAGQPATIIIYPEAKQSALNYKCNWNKHAFLIDSDKAAHNFASSANHSTGIKLFPIIEKYAKDGFNIGDNVAEIKVTGFDGCRLVAKRKNKQDRVFEIRYFKPNGFHEEK